MASQWAKGLPVVTVPRGDTPKRVTFVYPFYENRQFLWEQVNFWWQYPEALQPFFSAVIVDDGSPVPATLPPSLPFPIRLFRILVDVRWNWLAARNIGATHAEEGWLLFTEMDHVVPTATAQALVWGQHDPAVVYAFSRREHTGEHIAPHSASFMLTRELFWRIGGYDESLSGFYGTDGDFRRRVVKQAPIQILADDLVRYEYIADSSTVRYQRKQAQDAVVPRLVKARKTNWRPKVLSFPYQEVTTEVVPA
jgi:hypothetical protein